MLPAYLDGRSLRHVFFCARNVIVSDIPNVAEEINLMPNEIVPNKIEPTEIVPNEIVPNEIVPNAIVPKEIVPNEFLTKRNFS